MNNEMQDTDTLAPPNHTIRGDASDADKVLFYERQIDRLAGVVIEFFPDQIGKETSESAIDVSVRLLTDLGERRAAPATTMPDPNAGAMRIGDAMRQVGILPGVPDENYSGAPGKPTFSERFVTATVQHVLEDAFPKALEVWTVDADNSRSGNTVVLQLPDGDEAHGLIITVREVESVPSADPEALSNVR